MVGRVAVIIGLKVVGCLVLALLLTLGVLGDESSILTNPSAYAART